MAECSKCKSAIRGESGIRCNGVCNKIYHLTKKCAGVDQYAAKIMDEDNFIRFICSDCMQYIENVDLVLKEIQDTVNKNKHALIEYKHEFSCSLQQNENEIKTLLEAIENRYEARLKKMEDIQKLCEKNVEEVKKLYGNVKDNENKNKDICEKINNSNAKMCEEIKKMVKETNAKTKLSYAQTVAMPDVSRNVPLIIKPKEKQTAQKTKAELNEKVDPVNFKIKNVENRKNGMLIIQSENIEERDKIKEAIQHQINEKYEVRVPKQENMQIVITDINFKMSEKDMIEKLKKQNEVIKNSSIEIIKIFETKRYNKTIYNAKLKIDNESYAKIMSEQKLNIGWDRCRVFDGTSIIQCYKCQGYNHKSSDCRNEEVCYKCHGNHKSKDCNKEIKSKCLNCMKENNRLNLGIDENHATNSKECPVYKNKLNIKKKRIGVVTDI